MSESLFNPDTGEFLGGGGDGTPPPVGEHAAGDGDECPRCQAEHARADAILADLHAAEQALRKERRAVRSLQAELRRQREESPEGRVAKALFRYWLARCQKDKGRTKFGDRRAKVVVARLRDGYTPAYIARAIDGLAVGAYVSESGVRYDDLELVCRDEVHLERFYRIAEARRAPTLVGDAWQREFEPASGEAPEEPQPF